MAQNLLQNQAMILCNLSANLKTAIQDYISLISIRGLLKPFLPVPPQPYVPVLGAGKSGYYQLKGYINNTDGPCNR